MGGIPIRPDLPGIDLGLVHGVQTLDDAVHLLDHAERIGSDRVVVVGGGYIGLEMAEAFVRRGADVVLVERADQVMATLDPDMAELVEEALRRFGVDVQLGCDVTGFDEKEVVTADGTPARRPGRARAGRGAQLGPGRRRRDRARREAGHPRRPPSGHLGRRRVGGRRLLREHPPRLRGAGLRRPRHGGQQAGQGGGSQHRRRARRVPGGARHGDLQDLQHRGGAHRPRHAGGPSGRLRPGDGDDRRDDEVRLPAGRTADEGEAAGRAGLGTPAGRPDRRGRRRGQAHRHLRRGHHRPHVRAGRGSTSTWPTRRRSRPSGTRSRSPPGRP